MKAKAESKFQRVSHRKVRRILDQVRGKKAIEALAMLKFLPQSGAKLAYETLKSAMANATNNFKLKEDALVVSECYVCPSTPMKRFRPVSRGRAFAILKRTCHVTMFVEEK